MRLCRLKRILRRVKDTGREISIKLLILHQKTTLEEVICDEDKLYITNNKLGGGTGFFDYEFLKKKNWIVLEKVGTIKKEMCYAIINRGKNVQYILKKEKLFEVANHCFSEVVVNSLVGYEDYSSIMSLVVQIKRLYQSKIRYFVHDYYCVCPVYSLFFDGKYYPPADKSFPITVSCNGETVDMSEWKEKWLSFLKECDEIRCFSNSSKDIIIEAYPNLNERCITVVPHQMTYCKFTPMTNLDNKRLNIGVVGDVSVNHKGRDIVISLVKRYGNSIPISIIGVQRKQLGCSGKLVKYYGKYERNELQHSIEYNDVSCVLFPSIWPETFSFVISELIMMEIPIICFNLGAQAEKVKKYKLGKVINNIEELWNYIEELKIKDELRANVGCN